jgi:hypothetical protein
MNIMKLGNALLVTAALSTALMHAQANAAVDPVNFDSSQNPAMRVGGVTIQSGDYSFSSSSSFGVVNGDYNPSYGVSNHTPMLVFQNAGELTITRSDNGLFALGSLDVGGWANLATNTALLAITGHKQSGDVIATSALSTTSFAHVTTSALFTNLTSLTLKTTGYSGGSYYAAIDNLALAPVPEPETYAMMLAGLGLLAVVARRRKNTKG